MLLRFGKDIIDREEIVALVGATVYLRDGRQITGVGAETADALRAAMPPCPALRQDTQGEQQ